MSILQQLDLMAVFPNPGSGKFKVLFRMFDASPIQLIVHDLSGRIIHDEALKTEEGVNDLILDLSDAPSGTYFLKFVDHYGSTLNQSRISIK
ncbi:MAG: T9SS type A sorting domain-containing protein [Flavobacteriales bacterium]|nr:T9SS type A sorting domain-containing protein [Flavobacteriales bacterium]